MKVLLIGAMIVCAGFFVGCLTPEDIPQTTVQEAFPLTIGSHWTYATYDTATSQRDTVVVTVDQSTVSSTGDTTYQCTYRHRSRTDTSYVKVKNDTVVFATDETPPVNFILPFLSVSTWKYGQQYAVAIMSIGPDTVPSGPYAETVHIQEQSLLPNDLSHYDYWIAPGVGVVEFYDRTFITVSNTIHKKSWLLLSYFIAG